MKLKLLGSKTLLPLLFSYHFIIIIVAAQQHKAKIYTNHQDIRDDLGPSGIVGDQVV